MLSLTPRANPLARGPLHTRDDVQRAVRDLYEPLRPHTSAGGARVRLGSFGAVFEQSVAELEGFARPLYGLVPLAVGGGEFAHWDRIVAGLAAGTDPGSPEYWGAVAGDSDQRMVEQAAIGLALAFCPERVWEPLGARARERAVAWLRGIFEYEPVPNNWQFFRVLVALGLERVGAPFDAGKVTASLDRIESYRRGAHWYVDGALGTVDYYVPFALHTYGLMYAAANDRGLGSATRAQGFRERAAGFASDFQHWFAPDGAAIPMGRSLTYRFAMASFWGALAWADVESDLSWGAVRGLAMRHLRWWAGRAISDRDGVLSVGFAYDNRAMCESYNSAGSPYWCMKAFASLAAPAEHPFWTSPEEPLAPLSAPATLADAGWVVARDERQATAIIGREAPDVAYPEQAAAKYRKFAYSSAFGFSGDVPGAGGTHTDSMLALTDREGNRRVRLGIERAGIEDGMAWSTWRPFADVRVDTVCVAVDAAWHLRVHRIRAGRPLRTVETGFALPYTPERNSIAAADARVDAGAASLANAHGCSAIVELAGGRTPTVRTLAANSNIMHPHTAVPALRGDLEAGEHRLACAVFASLARDLPGARPDVPAAAEALLRRVSEDGA